MGKSSTVVDSGSGGSSGGTNGARVSSSVDLSELKAHLISGKSAASFARAHGLSVNFVQQTARDNGLKRASSSERVDLVKLQAHIDSGQSLAAFATAEGHSIHLVRRVARDRGLVATSFADKEMQDRLREHLEGGESYASFAKAHGLSVHTVRRAGKKYGFSSDRTGGRGEGAKVNLGVLKTYLSSGRSCADYCRATGIPVSAVRRVAHDAGLELKQGRRQSLDPSERDSEILQCARDLHMPNHQIAHGFGLTRQRVAQILTSMGFKRDEDDFHRRALEGHYEDLLLLYTLGEKIESLADYYMLPKSYVYDALRSHVTNMVTNEGATMKRAYDPGDPASLFRISCQFRVPLRDVKIAVKNRLGKRQVLSLAEQWQLSVVLDYIYGVEVLGEPKKHSWFDENVVQAACDLALEARIHECRKRVLLDNVFRVPHEKIARRHRLPVSSVKTLISAHIDDWRERVAAGDIPTVELTDRGSLFLVAVSLLIPRRLIRSAVSEQYESAALGKQWSTAVAMNHVYRAELLSDPKVDPVGGLVDRDVRSVVASLVLERLLDEHGESVRTAILAKERLSDISNRYALPVSVVRGMKAKKDIS